MGYACSAGAKLRCRLSIQTFHEYSLLGSSRSAQTLAFLCLLQTILLQAYGLDSDEASGILRAEIVQRIHRRFLFRVQPLGAAGASKDVGSPFIAPQSNFAVHSALRKDQAVFYKLPLGAEVLLSLSNKSLGVVELPTMPLYKYADQLCVTN